MDYKTKINKLIERIEHYDKHKPAKLSYLWPVLFNNSDQVPSMVKHYWTQEFNGLGFITTQELCDQLNTAMVEKLRDYDYDSTERLLKTAKKVQEQTMDAQQSKYGLLYTFEEDDRYTPICVTNEMFIRTISQLL